MFHGLTAVNLLLSHLVYINISDCYNMLYVNNDYIVIVIYYTGGGKRRLILVYMEKDNS